MAVKKDKLFIKWSFSEPDGSDSKELFFTEMYEYELIFRNVPDPEGTWFCRTDDPNIDNDGNGSDLESSGPLLWHGCTLYDTKIECITGNIKSLGNYLASMSKNHEHIIDVNDIKDLEFLTAELASELGLR